MKNDLKIANLVFIHCLRYETNPSVYDKICHFNYLIFRSAVSYNLNPFINHLNNEPTWNYICMTSTFTDHCIHDLLLCFNLIPYVILSYHSNLNFTPIKLRLECSLQYKKGKTIFSPNFYTHISQVKSPNNSYLLKNITCNMLRLNVSYNIHWKYKYNNDSACPSYLNTRKSHISVCLALFSLLTSFYSCSFALFTAFSCTVYIRAHTCIIRKLWTEWCALQ